MAVPSAAGRSSARAWMSERILSIPAAWRPVRAHPVALALVAMAGAVGLWFRSLSGVEPSDLTDLGLVGALPVSSIAALLLLTVSFCLSLRGPLREPLLLAHVVCLIAMLYGATSFIEEVPRTLTVWRHLGVVDYIVQHGSVDTTIDAYFNWPGFFVLGAFFTEILGLQDPSSLANWSPLIFNALYLPPLLVIMRSFTNDRRLVWLSIWLFYATNWVGQDHLSPQALAFFLYLALIAALLRFFPSASRVSSVRHLIRRLARRPAPTERADVPVAVERISPVRRAAIAAIVVTIFAAVVPSHQLTPYAALLTIAALVLFQVTDLRTLPVLMGVMILAWFTYAAVPFLVRSLGELLAEVGSVDSIVGANVTDRLGGTPPPERLDPGPVGSPGHDSIVELRIVASLVLWALALAGAAIRLLQGQGARALAALAIAPFLLLGLQSYGGEIVLRVYLFTLPAVAFLVASLIRSAVPASSWRLPAMSALLSISMLGLFVFARYGNERLDQFTRSEVAAVQHLHRIAPQKSFLISGSVNIPWRSRGYADHGYEYLTSLSAWEQVRLGSRDFSPLFAETAKRMREGEGGGYLILNRSTEPWYDVFERAPHETYERLLAGARRSPRFRRVYANRDAEIFVLSGRAGRGSE